MAAPRQNLSTAPETKSSKQKSNLTGSTGALTQQLSIPAFNNRKKKKDNSPENLETPPTATLLPNDSILPTPISLGNLPTELNKIHFPTLLREIIENENSKTTTCKAAKNCVIIFARLYSKEFKKFSLENYQSEFNKIIDNGRLTTNHIVLIKNIFGYKETFGLDGIQKEFALHFGINLNQPDCRNALDTLLDEFNAAIYAATVKEELLNSSSQSLTARKQFPARPRVAIPVETKQSALDNLPPNVENYTFKNPQTPQPNTDGTDANDAKSSEDPESFTPSSNSPSVTSEEDSSKPNNPITVTPENLEPNSLSDTTSPNSAKAPVEPIPSLAETLQGALQTHLTEVQTPKPISQTPIDKSSQRPVRKQTRHLEQPGNQKEQSDAPTPLLKQAAPSEATIIAELITQLQDNLKQTPYFIHEVAPAGVKAELYHSPTKSRDLTIDRLMKIKAKSLKELYLILLMEYEAILNSGTFFKTELENSCLAQVLKTSLDAIQLLKITVPTFDTKTMDWNKQILGFIHNSECSVSYKLVRFVYNSSSQPKPLDYGLAEDLFKLLLKIQLKQGQEEKNLNEFYTDLTDVIRSDQSGISSLQSLLKPIRDELSSLIDQSCEKLYNEHFSYITDASGNEYKPCINAFYHSCTSFIKNLEADWRYPSLTAKEDIDNLHITKSFLFDVMQCESNDDLARFSTTLNLQGKTEAFRTALNKTSSFDKLVRDTGLGHFEDAVRVFMLQTGHLKVAKFTNT